MSKNQPKSQLETATFGGGCFWCTEAIFQKLHGVESVVSGYAGGQRANPSYEQVTSGATGHAEVIQITFNPTIIPYTVLLDIFWHTHNPTTPNQQGADIGSQYRSVIFYHSDEQRRQAEEAMRKLELSGEYKDPIVTEILPFDQFFIAEDYHQNYYQDNPDYPYCTVVINPKLQKLRKQYGKLITP
jgi:methionine-S-sulfoxide reductase